MHSIKGGWVGQTFALAKRNESEGRKSRIRLSKEERKAMVESFIKKYQESNNGNFPSLNLTHKEVGGSFYTVREIVRDIIQENKVLGPAKFNLEELTSDQFFEQNPLGSIAKDPQAYLAASSIENHLEPNNLLDTSEEMLPVSDANYTGAEHQMVDKEQIINGSQVDVINKDPIEATTQELHVSEAPKQNVEQGLARTTTKDPIEATTQELQVSETPKQNVEQELATTPTPTIKVTPVTSDLIVETFPLRPVARTADRTEEGFGELRGPSNSPEKDIKILELEQRKERYELNGMEPTKNSNSFDEKFVDDLGNQISKNNSNGVHDEEKNLRDTLAESTSHSACQEHFDHEIEDCADPQVRVPDQNTITFEAINQSQLIDGAKTSTQDGFQTKNLTKTEGSKPSEEGLNNAKKHGVDDQPGGSSQRRSNPTVDRINLESWDGTPKNSLKQGPNPLVAIFRAFVDAFVKFWSE